MFELCCFFSIWVCKKYEKTVVLQNRFCDFCVQSLPLIYCLKRESISTLSVVKGSASLKI